MFLRLPCVALSLFALLLTACQTRSEASAKEGDDAKPAVPVHAVPVRLFTPQSGERFSASFAPVRELTLSFRVAGFVESIFGESSRPPHRLEAGDLIQEGTTLAVLRPKDYDIQILQMKGQLETARKNIQVARGQVAEAEAASAKADAGWKRADDLFAARALTAPEWEAAKAQRDIAVAQLDSARSQVEAATAQESAAAALSAAELAKTDTVLIAPYTARLLRRSIEVGSLVTPGQPAFTLVDTGAVKAIFGVPDSSIVGLKLSDRVPLSVEAIPGEISGTVTSIAAAADPATRLFLIEATVPNPQGTLRPGMIATVFLRASGAVQPVAVVPLSAIVRARGEAEGFSLMVVRANHVRSQAVTLGTTYADQIAVNGVQPGELVVSSGASLLSEGERVEVIQ
jgi:RND family efflux transporter MFP subunit